MLPGALRLNADPDLRLTGTWGSPRGRLLEIATTITTPGRWLALHVPLGGDDWTGARWLMLAARTSAAAAMAVRVGLRIGQVDGFADHFLPRAILAQPREADHTDLLALDRDPALRAALTAPAPWRDLILFLPPGTGSHLMLHDLRLIRA
jgi:hypothetical protein